MSAMVPPTMVAHVEPKPPCRKRAMITVWMFFALKMNLSVDMKGGNMTVSQGYHDVHKEEAACGHDVQRLSAELFAERGGEEGNDTEPERKCAQSNGCLEPCAVEVPRHRVKS